MRKIIMIMLLTLSFGVPPAFGEQGNGRSFLPHAKTALDIDDAQICAVPNVAWTALSKGYEVAILFDASGVTALKKAAFSAATNRRWTRRRCPSGNESR